MFKKISDGLPQTTMVVVCRRKLRTFVAVFNAETQEFQDQLGYQRDFGIWSGDEWCEIDKYTYLSQEEISFRKELAELLFKHNATIESDIDNFGNFTGGVTATLNGIRFFEL